MPLILYNISMKDFVKLIRPHHWVKNILIFFPIIFNSQLFIPELFTKALWGFIAFCLAASAVYTVNDICDAEHDKKHSVKKDRPIAAGRVSKNSAAVLASVLVIGALAVNAFISRSPLDWICLVSYLILNFAYSRGLKNVPILDVAVLVSGFLLRVVYGSAVTGTPISDWLWLTVISAAFFFGLGKRRGEMAAETDSRTVLRSYTREFLDKNMYVTMACALVFYSLWTVDPATVARMGTRNFVYTVPLVLVICMKYSLDCESKQSGDPVETVLRDKILIALIALYGAVTLAAIYL